MYLILSFVSYVRRDLQNVGSDGHTLPVIIPSPAARIIFARHELLSARFKGRGTYSEYFPGWRVQCSASYLFFHVFRKLFDCIFCIIGRSDEEIGVFMWTQLYRRIERYE